LTPKPLRTVCRHGGFPCVLPALTADALLTRICACRASMTRLPQRPPRPSLPPAGRSAGQTTPATTTLRTASPREGQRPTGGQVTRPIPPADAPGRREADTALRAFNKAYWVEDERAGGFYCRYRHGGRLTPFWQTAELIEMVEDVVDGTDDPVARRALEALWRGVLLRYGGVWTRGRVFNDDVMWMVIAALRFCRLTGQKRYLSLSKANFDSTVRRGWSDDLGGGLWWTTARREKNACVSGPAAIAACLLFEETDDPAYLRTAVRLYAWLRNTLFEPATGRVSDRVQMMGDGRGVVCRDASTYNQGTFIGAADRLFRATGDPAYTEDAAHALTFARTDLSPNGILRGEGDDSDGGGFKGIFARYAVSFARRAGLDDVEAWLRSNAHVAWASRDAHGLIAQDWARPAAASGRGPAAWDASSAVVLLQMLAASGR
jgi:predicted alpha-1,6-mannanase (GH76 family)